MHLGLWLRGLRGQVENLQTLPFTCSLDQTRQEDRVVMREGKLWEASALRASGVSIHTSSGTESYTRLSVALSHNFNHRTQATNGGISCSKAMAVSLALCFFFCLLSPPAWACLENAPRMFPRWGQGLWRLCHEIME